MTTLTNLMPTLGSNTMQFMCVIAGGAMLTRPLLQLSDRVLENTLELLNPFDDSIVRTVQTEGQGKHAFYAINAVAWLCCFIKLDLTAGFILALLFTSLLLCLAYIDNRSLLLPDTLTYGLITSGVFVS